MLSLRNCPSFKQNKSSGDKSKRIEFWLTPTVFGILNENESKTLFFFLKKFDIQISSVKKKRFFRRDNRQSSVTRQFVKFFGSCGSDTTNVLMKTKLDEMNFSLFFLPNSDIFVWENDKSLKCESFPCRVSTVSNRKRFVVV